MKKLTTLVCGAVLAMGLLAADAQIPGALQQVESVQQRRQIEQTLESHETGESAPELFPGETGDVGPQSILRVKPRRTWFEATADAQYFYTDNMFLNEHDRQSADVLVSTAQIALAPTPYELGCGRFTPRLGYRHQWFNFGLASSKRLEVFDFQTEMFRLARLNEFDFNVQTVFTDSRWTHENWTVETGFDFTRLLDSDDYNQFYREYVPRWGVQRIFPLCEKSAFLLGYAGDYRFTGTDRPPPMLDEDFNDRTDHALFAALNYMICPRATVQPFYRFTYTHFTSDVDRDDALHSFGVGLYCSITRQIGFRAFAGYDLKDSSGDHATEDYHRLDAGGGVNFTLRF